MKRLLLLLLLMPALLYGAAMSDAAALGKALTIWGPYAAIAKFQKTGSTTWTMQVGCVDPATDAFTIIGSALNSWTNAFAMVDLTKNGLHELTATATDAAGNQATSAPVGVYLCNK